jgi:hypothetical protein
MPYSAKLQIARWWNNTEMLREKLVPVSLEPPQMPHELSLESKPGQKKRPVKYFTHTVLFCLLIACSVVGGFRRFGRICGLDLQGSELCSRVTLNSLKLTNKEEPQPESRFAAPRLRYRQSPPYRPEKRLSFYFGT